MRSLRVLTGVLSLALFVSGCGGASGIEEGVPKVDMNKTYTPPAAVNTMSPKDYSKAKSSRKAAAATPAPADAPAESK